MRLCLTLLGTILAGSLAYAQAESEVGQNETNLSDLQSESSTGRKLVPILAVSQTSLQARDSANVTSKGSFEMAAGALYEIPVGTTGAAQFRTGLIYMPVKGRLISISGQETLVMLNQLAIPAELHYQIARNQVDGLYLKGGATVAMKTAAKIEGSESVLAANESVNGAGDLILGLGIGKNFVLNPKMDFGLEAQILKGQLGYKIGDQTLDQSMLQGLVTLNIKL